MFRIFHGYILDTLLLYPNGVSFNVLSRELKGRVSRITLLREIKRLSEMGIITIKGTVSHKQKKIFTVREDVINIANKLKVSYNNLSKSDAIYLIEDLINKYSELKKNIRDEFLMSYAKYRLKNTFSSIIERLE
jgi:DNA-binding Lrp family transcriptional regulator